MKFLWRLLKNLPLILFSPVLILVPILTFLVSDFFALLRRSRSTAWDTVPSTTAVSVVIPTWNGKDLLEKYLPSVVEALAGNPLNEIIVVDNRSSDGTAEYLLSRYPTVRVLEMRRNYGFGGGSNAGFRAARNDIVILLNNDMRVDPGFVAPLLEGFRDDKKVFAVSCQIFFSDPNRLREETGLTEGSWEHGALHVRHRDDASITGLFPCFYGGGGSCAFDRRKFLELGGFDHLYSPFYLEDTDLGYMAWKRGWKVLYQPHSVVYHEHRGTIGRKFSAAYIEGVLKKNFILFAWKNIHSWRMLLANFGYIAASSVISVLLGDTPGRPDLSALLRAFRVLPAAVRTRTRTRLLSLVSDDEAFRRPLGGYYRDRFAELPAETTRPSVLFVSPYPVCPPTHGGGVFMYHTIRELARRTDLHLLILLDYPSEAAPHDELRSICASVQLVVRTANVSTPATSIKPHAILEFFSPDVRWDIHRTIYTQQIDVLQLEYLVLGQYTCAFRHLACILFEHDVYFQSVARKIRLAGSLLANPKASYEYLRALRYELGLLPRLDRVQVCSTANQTYVESFLPAMRGRIDADLRAGINASEYIFNLENREPDTLLFLGSFRHHPNQEAMSWFLVHVWPRIRQARPQVRLVVIGSDPPPRHSLPADAENVELRGFVEDIREPLTRYSVFICPILTGSGVRVKLLEAFASGIPAVSTVLGAEGLTSTPGDICRLTDDPDTFAREIISLLEDPEAARAMAERARRYVLEQRDMPSMTDRLVVSYTKTLAAKRIKASESRSSRA